MVMLTLTTWIGWYLLGFSGLNFLFFPFHTLFLGSELLSPGCTRGGDGRVGSRIKLNLLDGGVSTVNIWISSLRKVCPFSLGRRFKSKIS